MAFPPRADYQVSLAELFDYIQPPFHDAPSAPH